MVFAMRSEILCKIICPNILISSYGNFEIPSSRIFDGGISGLKMGLVLTERAKKDTIEKNCYKNVTQIL